MKVLIACEESQRVCKAFRERGHEAYSCDIKKTSGGRPEWHILQDAIAVINGGEMRLQTGMHIVIDRWDLIIAHPPCTYLSNVATRHHSKDHTPTNWIAARTEQRIDAMRFFMRFVHADCDRVAIENPVGIMNTAYRKPDQIIEPYMFATDPSEMVTKRTCLWLKGLPELKHEDREKPNNAELFRRHPTGKARDWESSINRNRAEERSVTFEGIARAMAEQWG